MILLRFARSYLTPFLPWYLGGIAALAATNWLSVTVPMYVAEAIDRVRAGDPGDRLMEIAVLLAVMGVGIIAVRTLSRVLFFTPGRLVEAKVKQDLFDHLLRLQPAFLSRWPTGDLVSRASSDVNFLRLLAGFGVLQAINVVVAVALTVTQMVRISPTLTLYMLGPVVVGLVIVQLSIRRMFQLVHLMQQHLSQLSDKVLTSYQGIGTVQAFGAEDAFLARIEEDNQAYRDAAISRGNLRAVIGPALGLAASVDVFLLLYVGGPLAVDGDITVGQLAAFASLMAYLTGPLRSTSFLVSIFKQAQAALERIEALSTHEPERPDLPDPEPAPTEPPSFAVRHLTFAYPDAPDDPVLHDLSFEVEAGTTVGILGPTGSGKTTLLRCLVRLYNPPAGTVFVDGVDVCRVSLDGWREVVSLAQQRPGLFSESLAQNILMGEDDPERLARALTLAALGPDIEALPRGTDTIVGESGLMLSGGQRQRTALARSLVRPHGVLLLDDVLSAVDHETEQQLIAAIRSQATAPTTFIVANRVSALMHADHVLVLDQGRLVEQGAPAQLCAQDGYFRATWKRQQEEQS